MAETPKVKSIMYGTHDAYLHQNIDPDMLYWITDKGLLIRGKTIVTPTKVIDITPPEDGHSAYTFTIEAYENDPASPQTFSFEVLTRSGVTAITTGLQNANNGHINKVATDAVLGHVKLSDATEDLEHDAEYGATHGESFAATPKAVALVKQELTDYIEQIFASIPAGMTFKGTYGKQEDSPDEHRPLDQIDAAQGDMYICISTNMTDVHYHNNAGEAITDGTLDYGDQIICTQGATTSQGTVTTPARWTIVAGTSTNAVTTTDTLSDGKVIVGNGQKTVRKLTGGSKGHFLRQNAAGKAEWQSHDNLDHGIAYGECESAANEQHKTVELGGYTFQKYSIVAIRFRNGIERGDDLTITDGSTTISTRLPIIYHGDNIDRGIVGKGDTATFIHVSDYDLNGVATAAWVLISIDRAPDNTPTNLSAFNNDIQALFDCSTAESNPAKTVTKSGINIKAGSVFAVRFRFAVVQDSTLNINSTGAKSIRHRNINIATGQIRSGDTATFIYDGSYYHLLSVDRPYTDAIAENNLGIPDSDTIFRYVQQQVESATLYWKEMQ